MKEKEDGNRSIAVSRVLNVLLAGTMVLTQSTPSREINPVHRTTDGSSQNSALIGCETDGGYLNPDNPEEFTPGVYNDKWENCPGDQPSCYVDIPAVGFCVPPDFIPKKQKGE
jgi:hypothetical protein